MNKNTVVLIFPKLYSSELMGSSIIVDHPPLGILTIAAPLVEEGYHVIILDEQVETNFEDKIKAALENNPVCIGISSMSGSHIKSALRICKFIKKISNTPIVLGGVQPSISPRSTIEHEFIDIIVIDDGEETFPKVIKCLENNGDLNEIDGIAFKKGNEIKFTGPALPYDIQKLPKLPFHLVDLTKYKPGPLHFWPTDNRLIALETSRGCPYNCCFCTESIRKKKWRSLPPERVIEDILYYKEKYNVVNYLFIDDNFFGDKKRGKRIIELIIEKNLNINWYTNVRADLLLQFDKNFIFDLEKAGCKMLTFGAESGSQRILDMIDKNCNVGDCHLINKRLKQTKIIPHFVTIRGFPTETKADLKKSFLSNCKILLTNKNAICDFPHLIPTPGTKISFLCLGEKTNEYTLDDWSRAFEMEFLPEKPVWILDETYKFMKEHKLHIIFLCKFNRKKLSLLPKIFVKSVLVIMTLSFIGGFSKYIAFLLSLALKILEQDSANVKKRKQFAKNLRKTLAAKKTAIRP